MWNEAEDHVMEEETNDDYEEEEEEEADDCLRFMELTSDETLRAYSVKSTLESADDPELPLAPLTDFEYVQYAIATSDETDAQILERMAMMQAFRQEYQIHDTVEDGLEIIAGFCQLVPGFWLAVDRLEPNGNVCVVTHWSQFDPSKITSWQHYRLFLGTFYYTLQCRMCDFHAIRTGGRILAECGGACITSLQNFQEQVFSKLVHELWRWYPQNQEKTFFFNPPTVANFIFGLFKRFMTENQKSRLYLNYQIPGLEGAQIDPIYKTPTFEIAQQRMLRNCTQLLQERYNNQRQFVFPE